MKVVWLCQQEHILPWLNDLRHELGKLCEVVAYGDGVEFIPEFDAVKIVEREDPDVIMIGSNQYKFINLGKVKIPKALKCTDPWANIRRHVEFIKDNDVQLVLMNYNCATPEYRKHLPERIFGRLPHTLNTELFKPLRIDRIVDVMCVGRGCPDTYPLRYAVYNAIRAMDGINGWVDDSHNLPFEEYVRAINRAKMFAFGNVNRSVGEGKVMVFPMAKIYEIMGCKTLCLMDSPDEAEELEFFPDVNFVEITKENFRLKIEYCLNNPEFSRKVAEKGYEACLEHHTVQVRARELKVMLEEIMRK